MPPQFQNNNLQPANPENHHYDPTILLILVVAMVLCGAGAVWYFLSLPPEPEPQPIMKVDQFADWKTYRNEEFGFEFEFDSSKWVTEFYPDAETEGGQRLIIIDSVSGHDGPGIRGVSLSWEKKSQKALVSQFKQVTNREIVSEKTLESINNNFWQFIQTKPIKKFSDGDVPVFYYLLEKNGFTFVLIGSSDEENKLAFSIISTFKFISTSTPLGTSTSTPAR
jgi:hypothetical protein